ncbi:MAG: prolyl oligopeptidase family serine peptidase [Microscillaceae bacterium]|nr:prolyl oligopeptidase family serine peptidase [Microscillaceae bacterium]MDW8461624.1 prolyl oligopeptidase family serine peptidase [Cytophagales bacterium]
MLKTLAQDTLRYPATIKGRAYDTYFGVKVPDPYRWLEVDTSEFVKSWIQEQNKLTFSYLNQIPYREKIKARLTELANYPKYSSPVRAGEYYFFAKNDGLQNQSVYYYQKGLDGTPQEFLNPNLMSEDGTVAVSLSGFSKNKKYVSYNVSQSGSDWAEIRVMEVETKTPLLDVIHWVKFSKAAWYQDGFFYSAYDAPLEGNVYSGKNEFHKVYYHKLGDLQSNDQLVYEDKQNPLRYHTVTVTEDERFLILYISEGTDGTEVRYKNLRNGDKDFKTLFKGFNFNYSIVDNIEDKLLVYTNYKAPNYRLILVDTQNPDEANWKEIIPQRKELLDRVTTAGGKIFAQYLKDVTTRIYQYDLNGKLEREIQLPTLGTASGFEGEKDDKFIFYTFTSFTYPPTIYKYDIATGKSEVFRKTEVKFNPEDYVTKQVFFTSKDGTKVPMFIVHKKGLALKGKNPTYMYGYGGFNVNLTPSFSALRIVLLENNGVFAMVNLRGGGEYGEEWHKAGMLFKKQNVFDDFIAAAEYLIKEKYTSRDYLAIAGSSNGGLLVGACMTQRPDLFKVCFPAVGVLDMLRFHKFTVGWGWVVEYGSSERSKEEFENLYRYSPLHNIKEGVSYPATLVTTADHDDRVVPAHSYKFIATLQEKHRGKNPVLIRIETKAGHGAGKSITKIIEEQTDVWSFMFYNMGIVPKYK